MSEYSEYHYPSVSQAKNQLLPLCGATVYENVSRTGDVTYAKNPGNINFTNLDLYYIQHQLK